ncbi:transmembrane protein 94-like [Ptychodera flava]|uniref:transmembrane protein 94-like n=1 Tax=Ptychodera flava TaxID=63121 RepID=UPI00396A4A3B
MSSLSDTIGLSNREALKKLHVSIEGEIRAYQKDKHLQLERIPQSCYSLDYQPYCLLHWTSAASLALTAVLVLICYGCLNTTSNYHLMIEAVIVFLLLIINLYVSGSDKKLRRKEMQYRAEHLLRTLQACITSCASWDEKLYPDLNMPLSRSVSLQWTYRDGNLVNLPCNLLVKGDIIALRPGQLVPTKVQEMEPVNGDTVVEFEPGQMYNPCTEEIMEEVIEATAHEPMKPVLYKVLQTPYADTLKKCLWNATNRPVGLLENKRLVCNALLERRILPVVLMLSLLANVVRYVFLQDDVGHWSTMIILLPLYSILPLLALVVPIMWVLVNAYGVSRILTCYEKSKQSTNVQSALQTMEITDTLIRVPHDVSLNSVWHYFLSTLFGKCNTLTRTANVMQALGTMTELSCVDKTGILSYPNPSVEKVFFFSSLSPEDEDDDDVGDDEESDEEGDGSDGSVENYGKKTESKDDDSVFEAEKASDNEDYFPECHVEVLDLTECHSSEIGLQFDDPNWERHMTSLKPLGLNILINTCNMDAMQKRTEFIDHITCIAALQNLPLVTRRCICDLARLIGFSDQAGEAFELQQQLATYKKVPVKERENIVKSIRKAKSASQKKYTLPHMMSVVVGSTNANSYQMLTEGTAEMVLDACTDFWDGSDLCVLTESDRKKVLDFYHRASLSAYCCAFAYRPLPQTITSDFSDSYIEMPTAGLPRRSVDSPSPVRSPTHNSITTPKKKSRQSSADSTFDHLGSISDPNGVFRAQSGQIFIGMVAMQYQAKEDIVGLIEHLDNACIRFVHFSPDNELKSKVFAEKVGLEVGWNCHISLRSTETPPQNQVTTQLGYTTPSTRKSSLLSLTKRKTQEGAVHLDLDNVQVRWSDKGTKDDTDLISKNRGEKLKIAKSLDFLSCTSDEEMSYELLHSKSVGDVPKCSSGDLTIDIQDREYANESTPLKPSKQWDKRRDKAIENGSGKIASSDVKIAVTDEDAMNRRVRHVSETCTFSTINSEEYEAEGLLSSHTESAFEMTNRAKLPRGIGNIRPHLENVDNVPLLVPLFTDSTPSACQEMIAIMQEYGEIVCCLGSSANFYNTGVFLQADISIGLEPLYPQVCQQQRQDEYLRHCDSSTQAHGLLPLDLSHLLASLPCSLSFHREDNISLIYLVKEARGITQAMINCFIFLMNCQVTISVLQLIACFLLLPHPLMGTHILWLSCVVVPLLSMSFYGTPGDSKIMRMAPGKNLNHWDRQVVGQYMLYFVFKFIPSILICILVYALCLNSFCVKVMEDQAKCHVLLGERNNTESWNGWKADYYEGVLLAQNLLVFLLVIYFVCISASFVYPVKLLWKQHPFTNKVWCVVAPSVLILQVFYFLFDMVIWRATQDPDYEFGLEDIPMSAWLVGLLWPLVLILKSEIIKIYEISLHVRNQKRAKLQFGTKLGMNSPF